MSDSANKLPAHQVTETESSAAPQNAPQNPAWVDDFLSFYRQRFGESAGLAQAPPADGAAPSHASAPPLSSDQLAGPLAEAAPSPEEAPGWMQPFLATLGETRAPAAAPPPAEPALLPAPETPAAPPPESASLPVAAVDVRRPKPGLRNVLTRLLTRPDAAVPQIRWFNPYLLLAVSAFLIAGALTWFLLAAADFRSSAASRTPAPKPATEPAPPAKPFIASRVSSSPPAGNISVLPSVPPANSAPAILTAIRFSSSPHSTAVVIGFSGTSAYTVNRLSNPERIYIDFTNARLSPLLNGRTIIAGKSCLQKYRVSSRGPRVARLTFETGGLCDYATSSAPASPELAFTLRPRQATR